MIDREWLETYPLDRDINAYRKKCERYLCTNRFNNQTFLENRRYVDKIKSQCLYSNPYGLPSYIKKDAFVYVLEMNNEENKIMGIGRVRNDLQYKIYRVYDEACYNQYHFVGNKRKSCSDMNEKEKELISALEDVCFKGRGHLKRGHRMLSFTWRILYLCHQNGLDIIAEIDKMMEK